VRWGTSDPIAKATVELRPVTSGTSAPYVATTTAEGTFVFARVPAGQYRVTATRPGFVSAEYGQRWPGGAGTPLTLPPGQAVSNVPVPMLQTGAISGTVRDAVGTPIAAVEVQALKASYQTGRRVLTPVQIVVTDDRGEYRLFWLTPGTYFVVARHPEVNFSPMRAGGLSIGGGGPMRYQSFRSNGDNAGASAIAGAFGPQASDGPGQQLAPAERYLAEYYPGTTDDTAAATLDVGAGAEVTSIDFTVAPVSMHRVRGRVVYESNNEPAMSAVIQWITPTGATQDLSNQFLGPVQLGARVECCDGAFAIALPSGQYTLVAAVNNRAGRATVTVGDSDVDNVVLAIGPVFNFKGRVTFEGHELTMAELGPMRLSAVMEPPIPGLEATGFSNILSNGTFTFQTGVGDFRLSLTPLLPPPRSLPSPLFPQNRPGALADAYVKSIRIGDADVLNNGLHVVDEVQQPVEIVLSNIAGALEGRVTDNAGRPVPNVPVVLMPDAARRGRIDLVKRTSSDASGRYRFDKVPPGDYLAFAFDGVPDDDWLNPEFRASRESQGKSVKVTVGTAATAELTAVNGSQ